MTIDHDQIEHLGSGIHLHCAEADLPGERLIGAQQQLLSCLTASVERTRDLRAAK